MGPWICVIGVAVYVLVSPLVLRSSLESPLWIIVWLATGAVAVAVVAYGAVRLVRAARAQTDELHHLDEDYHDVTELLEVRRVALESLVVDQLPALSRPSGPPLPDVTADDTSADLLERAGKELAALREDQRARQDAVSAALVSLGRKVQASAHRIQEEAARMVQRHPADPDVLQTSMRVDHAAAQQARNAQSLAALCGEWPGQQWHQPLPVSDVVRAAAGRITAYQRVEVSGEPGVAVTVQVVEPLIHLVAELLANATQSSPPTTQVLVSLRQVQRGAVIEIDDGGVGVDDAGLDRIREIASGRREIRLADLGEIPQTGLPVVGTYARRHGFRVDVTQSVYGGLRAIVLVPAELTEPLAPSGMLSAGTHVLAKRERPSLPAPTPSPETVTESDHQLTGVIHPEPEQPEPTDPDATPELPRRRSRRGEARGRTEWPSERPPSPRPAPTQSPEEAGQWMGAFLTSAEEPEAPQPDLDNPPEER
jgi:signal transduction histidine kinase